MKKIYNSPVITVVKIHTVSMIAGSNSESLSGASEHSGGGSLTGSRDSDSLWEDEE